MEVSQFATFGDNRPSGHFAIVRFSEEGIEGGRALPLTGIARDGNAIVKNRTSPIRLSKALKLKRRAPAPGAVVR